MKYSPSFSNVFLSTIRDGSPPRSPRSSLRALGIMQAVTLACTAAFAAGSTALLFFVVFLSRQPNNGNLLGIYDWPNNAATVKCDHPRSQRVNEISPRTNSKRFSTISKAADTVDANREAPNVKSRYSRRRSILSNTQQFDGEAKITDGPTGAIWLMSFPNSGTSYTIHLVRELTNTTTATNYGLEGDIKDEPSVPAFNHGINGPFLERIPGRYTNIPPLILTKTHCGGFSTSLNPTSYIETPRSFLKSCLKGKRGVYSSDSKSVATHSVWYSQDLVKKIVHIFRSPLDNVVARFHLKRKRFTARKNKKWLHDYPDNKLGFHKWCKSIDDSQQLARTRWIDRELGEAFLGVPCHAEFYRYVEWHNYADGVKMDLGIPTMVFYYEDYSTRFDDVTEELLNFLELEHQESSAPVFIVNKKYDDYYSKEQTQAITALVKELSNKRTWKHLAHYFGENGV